MGTTGALAVEVDEMARCVGSRPFNLNRNLIVNLSRFNGRLIAPILRLGWARRHCFSDCRDRHRTEHSVDQLVRHRLFGIAPACEDLNDHHEIRRDGMLVLACGRDDLTGSASGPATESILLWRDQAR